MRKQYVVIEQHRLQNLHDCLDLAASNGIEKPKVSLRRLIYAVFGGIGLSILLITILYHLMMKKMIPHNSFPFLVVGIVVFWILLMAIFGLVHLLTHQYRPREVIYVPMNHLYPRRSGWIAFEIATFSDSYWNRPRKYRNTSWQWHPRSNYWAIPHVDPNHWKMDVTKRKHDQRPTSTTFTRLHRYRGGYHWILRFFQVISSYNYQTL